jgi:hypothetical protein
MFSLPCAAAACTLRRTNVGKCRPLKIANIIVIYIRNTQHLHMKWYALLNGVLRSTHTQESELPQQYQIIRNTIKHTHAASSVSVAWSTPGYAHIHKIKLVRTKRCSLRYTYRRNCSPTTKMKLIAIQQDGWPTINSNCKTLPHSHGSWTRKVSVLWLARSFDSWHYWQLLLSEGNIPSLVPWVTNRCHFLGAHSAYPSASHICRSLIAQRQIWQRL